MFDWFKKDDLKRFERSLLSNVEKHGCHIIYVGGDEALGEPSWGYSVGFTQSLGQGEVICTGARLDAAEFYINTVFARCRDDELVLADGVRVTEVLPDCDLVVRSIAADRITNEWFNSANWFHRRIFGTNLTKAFQLVWPSGLDGCYPWDEQCQADFKALQPALYETRLN